MAVARPVMLLSKKQPFSITASAPAGWIGPTYKGWPSYEVWSFSNGEPASASFIEIRLDPARETKLDLNTATADQVKKTFNDFTNPEVEKIANTIVGQTPVVIWAVHNVDGELLIAELRRKSSNFHFTLRTQNRKSLRHYDKTFLDLVKSVQILTTEPGLSPKSATRPEH